MARTKLTARIISAGKAPHEHHTTKGARHDTAALKRKSECLAPGKSTKSEASARKPHLCRPGTVALHKIRKYQTTTDLQLGKGLFGLFERDSGR